MLEVSLSNLKFDQEKQRWVWLDRKAEELWLLKEELLYHGLLI
jgi:hypothetical protein